MKNFLILFAFCALLFACKAKTSNPEKVKTDPSPTVPYSKIEPLSINIEDSDPYKESNSFENPWYSRVQVKKKLLELANSKDPRVKHEAADAYGRHALKINLKSGDKDWDDWYIRFTVDSNEVKGFEFEIESRKNDDISSSSLSDEDFDGFPDSLMLKGKLFLPERVDASRFPPNMKFVMSWNKSTGKKDPITLKSVMTASKKSIKQFLKIKI